MMDDIKAGDYLTVVQGQRLYGPDAGHDRSYCGAVLKVLAVDLPFVCVLIEADKYGLRDGRRRTSLNLSELKWKPLGADYVEAMNAKLER